LRAGPGSANKGASSFAYEGAPVIEIHELTKYFGERKGVGPLSFRIEKGEVIGLLGLNGAGKTTTLRMLASELLPTAGRISVDGVDLVEEPERVRSKIGYLPDRPPLYADMVVRDFLTFAAKLRKMKSSAIAKRVEEVIGITDLGDHADLRIDMLSHGYRQRVGIAQAIVHEPALLLLDEPISGLDPVQIVEMRNLVRSLRGNHTIVLSSHILSEISETCDRLLIIREGEIVASGTEEALSAQMAAAKSFEVTVRAPVENEGGRTFEGVQQLIEDVDGVESVSRADSTDGGERVVSAAVVSSHDVRELVCKELVEAGYGVMALERGGKELEDVFLQLTGKQGSAGSTTASTEREGEARP
jgi:ABC-2 type transport system ATP-binding protein